MASSSSLPWADKDAMLSSLPSINPLPLPLAIATAAVLLLAVIVSMHSRGRDNTRSFPLLNPRRTFELTGTRAKNDFNANSFAMMREGTARFPDTPFRIQAFDFGESLILPPRYASEIRNDARFSFAEAEAKRMHSHLPGFGVLESFRAPEGVVIHMAQNNLTQAFPRLIAPLSRECGRVFDELLTDAREWHDTAVTAFVLPLIARLSTLTFLGEERCHDPEWIELTTNFTIAEVVSAFRLSQFPWYLRRLANRVLPECRNVRVMEKRAYQIIEAQAAKRQQLIDSGEASETDFNDALAWYQTQFAKRGGKYDPTTVQLTLSHVAIHTTSDLLCEVVLDLARHEELIEPLRKEIREVLADGSGLSKAKLHEMKLLDSVIKETQRMKPAQVFFLERITTEDVTLSGNIHLKKGASTFVQSTLRDPTIYENPDVYDGYRFYRMRQQPGKENMAQLVTTSGEYFAFGHGQHACPGRFFAAAEVKVAVCRLLLEYDLKLAKGCEGLERVSIGNAGMVHPLAKISIRRREVPEAERLVL